MAKTRTTDELFDEMMALAEGDRAALLDRLWDAEWRSIPGFEHPIEDEEYWREELARRAADPEDEDVPWEVVKAEALAIIHGRE